MIYLAYLLLLKIEVSHHAVNFSAEQFSHLLNFLGLVLPLRLLCVLWVDLKVIDAPVFVLTSVSHLLQDCLAEEARDIIHMVVDLFVSVMCFLLGRHLRQWRFLTS